MPVQKPSDDSTRREIVRRLAHASMFGLLATGLLASCASQSAIETRTIDPTKVAIATAGPMTGRYASFGERLARGAAMAVQDLNAAGGVLGRQVQIVVGDDACDPRQAVSVANQMANDGVVFMAGHFCSGPSIPASQVYTQEGILQISPASTNPALTDDGGDNVYRVCGRDDRQADVAAQYLAENYADARVAIVHDRTAYGKGLADIARNSLTAAGVTVALYQAIAAGRSDYSGVVSRLKSENIDVLYIGGYHTEAGLIARQAQEQGMDIQIVGADSLVTDEYWSITGDAGEGTLMTFGPDPRVFPEALDTVQRFRGSGYEPDGYTLYAYAAVQVWAQAAETAGTFDVDAIGHAMRSNRFQTVLGELTFDDNGDIEQTAFVMYQWSRNNYRQITQLEP